MFSICRGEIFVDSTMWHEQKGKITERRTSFRPASQCYTTFCTPSSTPFNSSPEKPTYPIIPQSTASSVVACKTLDQPPVFLSPQFLRSLVASYYASAAKRISPSFITKTKSVFSCSATLIIAESGKKWWKL